MTPPLCVGEWRERRCEGVRVAVVSAHLDLPQKWHFSAAYRSTQAVDREDGRVCSKHNEDKQDAVHDGQPDPRVVPSAWSTLRTVRVRRCTHHWGGEAHDIVALWVFRGRAMPAIVEDVEDTELFDWEEVADVAAQRESASRTNCAGRARRSRGLCWRGVCSSEAWRAGEGRR
ncbi:hypothetical protein TcYC6_0033450 [Trypanosoma cruzi]|nr:hypothetical protein TcYC6_0033450 [Trypanosoma cruzi]